MGAREAVGALATLEVADARAHGAAAVAPDRVRVIERLQVGLGVRRQRVQVADLSRDVVAVLVVVDARELALVAATFVLAVGRMRARGAAVANFDAAGAERAVDREAVLRPADL